MIQDFWMGSHERRVAAMNSPTMNGLFFRLCCLLPNKPRGVPRVDDRRVLNGILWRFRTGSPWAEIPKRYGPPTTCYNRVVRSRKAGVWDPFLKIVLEAYGGDIIMIDSTYVRLHQHATTGKRDSGDDGMGGTAKVPPIRRVGEMAAKGVPVEARPARSTRSSRGRPPRHPPPDRRTDH